MLDPSWDWILSERLTFGTPGVAASLFSGGAAWIRGMKGRAADNLPQASEKVDNIIKRRIQAMKKLKLKQNTIAILTVKNLAKIAAGCDTTSVTTERWILPGSESGINCSR